MKIKAFSHQVITFNTVEDFWSVYNHIEPASRLQTGCDYSLFKEGIKPMWEDPGNKAGGRWLVSLDKKQRLQALDKFWLNMMMALIGENFGTENYKAGDAPKVNKNVGELVNGAVLNVRPRMDKIGLWLKTTGPEGDVMHIGWRLKEHIGMEFSAVPLNFEVHADVAVKRSSTVKHRFQI